LSRLSADQNALYEVEEALKRIENGTYGLCAQTGKPIPALRLKAIPWTRFGKEIELRLERTRDVKSPHLGELRSITSKPFIDLAESPDEEDSTPANDESLQPLSRGFVSRANNQKSRQLARRS